MAFRDNFDLSVYFIADSSVCGGRRFSDVVVAAVRGGATMVQLRNKVDGLDVVAAQAREIRAVLAESGVPFVVNDHVGLAVAVGADGVHIGQGDMDAAAAREIIGDEMILGVTAFTRAHFAALDPAIVDYAGTGPFYTTLTKPDKAVLGAEGFALLAKDSPVPVVGIGGITPDNAGAVIRAGASGVAMMRAVSEADDPAAAAGAFVRSVREARS